METDNSNRSHRPVDSVMHSPVVTIDTTATLRSAAVALHEAGVGTLAIVDGPILRGILSERDVVGALAGGADPDRARVAEAMSGQPRYLTCGEPIAVAVEVMVSAGIRHLPVLEEGAVVGMVSMRDLVAALRS